ncbi:hypothetical protein H5410_007850 [Solanum commersonii]|uniref:TOG domain-containing protein n=1 Tax=Solanum commersonii TaxID=4109 RepID=A0A9J6ADL0_SOLCO|nr:hypothetical protein H5410_007850 [Solanum commersonii]
MSEDEKLLKEAKKLPWDERLAHKNWKVRNDANIDLAAVCDSITDPKDPRLREFGPFFRKAVADSNAPVQDKALDALICYLKAADSDAGRYAKEVCDAIVAKCLTGRPKTVEKAQMVFLLWIELEAVEAFLAKLNIIANLLEDIFRGSNLALNTLFSAFFSFKTGDRVDDSCSVVFSSPGSDIVLMLLLIRALLKKSLGALQNFEIMPKGWESKPDRHGSVVEATSSLSCPDAMEKAIKNKVAKAVVPAIDVMFQALSEFGTKIVPPKRILKMLPELFDHQDQNVRASSKGLTLELCRWIGKDPVKSILFEKMRDTMLIQERCIIRAEVMVLLIHFFDCVGWLGYLVEDKGQSFRLQVGKALQVEIIEVSLLEMEEMPVDFDETGCEALG